MAGSGSDWHGRRSTKLRTDHYPSIDIRQIAPNLRLDTFVILAGGVLANLEWKSCHFGGTRPYFKCPSCGARSCILYRTKIKSKFTDQYGCQKCLDMVHPVENEGKLERSVRRNHKAINRRIYDSTRPEGKPLWMRWPTWRRLCDQFTVAAARYFECTEQIMTMTRSESRSSGHKK